MKAEVGVGEVPRRLRLAALLAVLLTGLCGLFSAWDGFLLFRIAELKDAQPLFKLAPDPVLAEELRVAQVVALEHMREPRMVVVFALALVCSLSFVAATRLLRPAGLPREGVRRILVLALLVAAVLRTLDGAQMAVVGRSAAEVLRHGLPLARMNTPAAETALALLAPVPFIIALVQTALVVGPFLFLSQYFRSLPVKAWVAKEDGRTA